jgi:hypothetical protein
MGERVVWNEGVVASQGAVASPGICLEEPKHMGDRSARESLLREEEAIPLGWKETRVYTNDGSCMLILKKTWGSGVEYDRILAWRR